MSARLAVIVIVASLVASSSSAAVPLPRDSRLAASPCAGDLLYLPSTGRLPKAAASPEIARVALPPPPMRCDRAIRAAATRPTAVAPEFGRRAWRPPRPVASGDPFPD